MPVFASAIFSPIAFAFFFRHFRHILMLPLRHFHYWCWHFHDAMLFADYCLFATDAFADMPCWCCHADDATLLPARCHWCFFFQERCCCCCWWYASDMRADAALLIAPYMFIRRRHAKMRAARQLSDADAYYLSFHYLCLLFAYADIRRCCHIRCHADFRCRYADAYFSSSLLHSSRRRAMLIIAAAIFRLRRSYAAIDTLLLPFFAAAFADAALLCLFFRVVLPRHVFLSILPLSCLSFSCHLRWLAAAAAAMPPERDAALMFIFECYAMLPPFRWCCRRRVDALLLRSCFAAMLLDAADMLSRAASLIDYRLFAIDAAFDVFAATPDCFRCFHWLLRASFKIFAADDALRHFLFAMILPIRVISDAAISLSPISSAVSSHFWLCRFLRRAIAAAIFLIFSLLRLYFFSLMPMPCCRCCFRCYWCWYFHAAFHVIFAADTFDVFFILCCHLFLFAAAAITLMLLIISLLAFMLLLLRPRRDDTLFW